MERKIAEQMNNPGFVPGNQNPYGVDPNQGFNQNQGFNPNQGFNSNQGFNQNQGFNPNQGYNPNPNQNYQNPNQASKVHSNQVMSSKQPHHAYYDLDKDVVPPIFEK